MSIDVDGITKTVEGGPFHMPTDVNGLAILLSSSKGLSGGIRPDAVTKAVRLEVADSVAAWTAAWKLTYPIRNYRWHAMNYQHTFLGVAVNQSRLYYHRGEDMGMIPDRELAVAVVDGVVKQIPGPTGDGASNAVILHNSSGFDVRYAHMNTPYIFVQLQPGVSLPSGAPLGLTGNTWEGRPVRDPHLHWNLSDAVTGAIRNTFPMAVEAFRQSFPGEPLPIAGGWRHLYAGGSLTLDGSLSLPGTGRALRSFEWTFTDGSKAKGKKVTRSYPEPGTYSESLKVTDGSGQSDLDFVEVFVLSRNQVRPPPFALINYFPIRNIRPGTEIEFLTRFSNMKDVTIDFGDGQTVQWAETLTHAYKKSGVYLVTVRGKDTGSGPGTFHVRVHVD
ncbi:MAG: peptidoglycan DD-metalloendopeptidase family protein [Bryobacterales bacterium]|nr:peptidoglycan DD-metalloendopeptidase family protein [Bryobacterales bacterium]